MQRENFHLLDGLDGLVAGQGFQVQRGVGCELEGVCPRAAVDAAACSKRALQAVAVDGDGVVADLGVQGTAGVGQTRIVGGGYAVGGAASHDGVVARRCIRHEGHVVNGKVAKGSYQGVCGFGAPKRQANGLGAGCGVDDRVVTAFLVGGVVDGQRGAIHIGAQAAAAVGAVTQIDGVVELEGVALARLDLRRGLPEHSLGAAGDVHQQLVARHSPVGVAQCSHGLFVPADVCGCARRAGAGGACGQCKCPNGRVVGRGTVVDAAAPGYIGRCETALRRGAEVAVAQLAGAGRTGDRPECGIYALVACWVQLHSGEAVRARRGRGDGGRPLPTGIGRGGGHQVGAGAVIDINRGIGFAGARDGGDCVGGAAARADVGAGAVLDGGDEWRIGSQVGVDHLGLHWTGVARGVDHLGGVGPTSGVAVGVGDGPCGGTGSNMGVTDEGGAVVRVNRELLTCTQRCAECAADQTASAGVGGVPVGGCDAGAGVFGHRGELDHLCRRLGIDIKRVGAAGGAGAAIDGGFGCDVVSAVCQRVGGDGPVAAAVGGGGAQHRAAVVERDCAARNGRAGEGWRGVVGAAVVGHGAVFGCRVVIGAGDDRAGGRRGAHGQAEWVTLAALVACGVRQGVGQGVCAVGQRADGRERAGGRVISGRREDAIHIQFGRTGQAVADVQARGGVVGDGFCAGEVLAVAEVVVVGGGCARRGGRNSVHLDGVGAAGGAGVAGGIGGRGLDAVGAIGERAGRDGPAAAGVGRACTDHGGAVVQRDRTACFGGAAEGRRAVVGAAAFGDITDHRCRVVIGARDGWDTGSEGVNGEVERCALAAFVASGIAQRVGERMGAVGQLAGRRERAGRGVISGRCEHAIDVQLGRVGQAGADVQARRAVVGDGRQAGRVGEGARVVNVGAGRTRGSGCGGVDGDGVGAAGIADITGCIGGGGGEVISAFAQDAGGDGPLAIGIGRAGANDGAAVVQRDGAARFGGAAEGGRGVVGVAAVGHNAGRGRHVIGGVGDDRRVGCCGVDREIETAAGRTGVAGSVGGGGGDGVVACRQGAGRDGPVAAVVGRDAANHSGAVVQRDGAARFCRATESGRGVVGAAVVGQGVGHRCHVVVGADDERNVGRGGVDGRTAAALGAGVASGVNDVRGHRQGAAVGRLGEAGGDVAFGHIGVVQCDGARCSAIGDDDLIADVDGACPADLDVDVGTLALGGVDGAVVIGVGGDDHSGCPAVIGHTGVDGQDTRGAAVGTVAADHSIGRGFNDGGFEGVAAIGQGLRGVVPRPVGTVGRRVAAVDDGIAAVDDLDFELFCGGVEACGQLATVDECGVVGDEVAGAHAGVGRNGGDGDRRDDVDDHGQIDQHLRASGAVVIDLVGVLNGIHTRDSDLALVVPLARQTGVADHAAQTGDAVVEQCVEVQGVGAGAVDHELHLACALGGAGCGHRAIGCLRSGRKAVIAHGGGVGTTEREHVVGRHRDGRIALQGEDFDFLNGFDRLVVGQHFEVERGVGREHKRVNACAADDEAAIHKRALQGIVTGRNRVVVGQGVQHATGVG